MKKHQYLHFHHSSVSFIKQVPENPLVPVDMQRAEDSTALLLPLEAGSHLRLFHTTSKK